VRVLLRGGDRIKLVPANTGRVAMTTMHASKPDGTRPIDRWFAHYSDDHLNAVNQRIHVLAVPLILWSVIALLWCIPTPGTLFHAGIWAGVAMAAAADVLGEGVLKPSGLWRAIGWRAE